MARRMPGSTLWSSCAMMRPPLAGPSIANTLPGAER